jgi:fluoroacetyl-CoA thioesterase
LIPIGTTHESTIVVTDENAVSFLGVEGARVLGTPYMIGYLEMTARDSVKPFLDDGYDTVGARVDVRHLAATPMGMRVTFRSEVTGVDDRRLHFKVEAFDEKRRLGRAPMSGQSLMLPVSRPVCGANPQASDSEEYLDESVTLG